MLSACSNEMRASHGLKIAPDADFPEKALFQTRSRQHSRSYLRRGSEVMTRSAQSSGAESI